MFLHVLEATYVAEHRIHVRFNDGVSSEIDLAGSLGGPIFEPLKDMDYFREFSIEGNTLAWPNGADFAPEYLYDLAQSLTFGQQLPELEPPSGSH